MRMRKRQWIIALLLCLPLCGFTFCGDDDPVVNNFGTTDPKADPTRGDADKPIEVNIVRAGGTCTPTSTTIGCKDASVCLNSDGSAVLCARIEWSCENTVTGLDCGSNLKGAQGGEQTFTRLTPSTLHLIRQVTIHPNGSEQPKDYHRTTLDP